MGIQSRRSRAPRLRLAAVAVTLLAGLAPAAHATFLRTYSVPELWTYADCVIEAVVDSTTWGVDPVSLTIVTHVHLNVLTVYQGACLQGPRILTLAGGRSGAVRLTIPLSPTFTPNEHVLLFLDEYPGLLFPVIAMDQGKFTITSSLLTGRETFHNRLYRSLDRAAVLGTLRPAGGNR